MTNRGKVIKFTKSNKVTLAVYKYSSCSSCGKCSDNEKYSSNLIVDINSEVQLGDEIVFEADDKDIFKMGALIYLLPILFLFFGYYIGAIFFEGEGLKIMSGFIGTFCSLVIIKVIDKIYGKQIAENIKIKEVIK